MKILKINFYDVITSVLYNGSLKVVVETRYQCLNTGRYMMMGKNLIVENMVHLSKNILHNENAK